MINLPGAGGSGPVAGPPLTDQYVPEDFRDEIDLPDPGIDQSKVNAYDKTAKAEHARALKYKAEAASLRKQIAKKGISSRTKARLQSALKRADANFKSATSKRDSAQTQRAIAGGKFGDLLKGEERDAYASLKALFGAYGLGSLAPKIFEYVQEGYQADTIALLLQDTKEYKERFAANDARRKAGLAVLAPAEYLSVEASYRQVLENAGLPKGFYDSPADFRSWIGSDVSPTEIKGRVDLAVAATTQANPSYRAALYEMYGIGEKELAAYFLDRKKAEPLLKKQAAAAAIGAAAMRRGIRISVGAFEDYAAAGITREQAEEGYARVAEGLESMLGIAGRFRSTWSVRESERETFGLGDEQKGKRLKSQERALFAGSVGASASGLSGGYRQT